MARAEDGRELVAATNPDGSLIGSATGTSSTQVQGTAADGAAAVGNPVDVALEYLTTPATLTNGQHKRAQANSVGALMTSQLGSFYIAKASPAAFDGGTANARGNSGGTSDPLTLFTVTGDVLAAVYGVCTTDLATTTGTVSVGPAGNATLMLPATAAGDIDASEVWTNATPAIGKSLDSLTYFILGNGNIVEDTATANVTGGQMYYICLWQPLSAGSKVEAV